MEYSPIKFFRVKNFRNIGDITVDFTGSPIISLVGDNESGKTSIIKAFAVLALHAYPRDQKDFIRDGTRGFGLALGLEDGTIITRMKADGINSYKIELPNGQVWETNKIDSGLPTKVQEIVGLLEEPETGEFLHIRTYEDQLLFVVTPSSTNYKVMYNALKVDYLTKAIRLGLDEVNALKKSLEDKEKSIKTLLDEVRQIKIYDIEPVINIRARLQNQLDNLELIEKAIELKDNVEKIESKMGILRLIEDNKLQSINIEEALGYKRFYTLLNSLTEIKKKLNIYEQIGDAKTIDITVLKKLKYVKEEINKLDVKSKLLREYVKSEGLNEIDSRLVGMFERALSIKTKVEEIQKRMKIVDVSELKEIDTSVTDVIAKFKNVASYYNKALEIHRNLVTLMEEAKKVEQERDNLIKQLGISVVECPRCNELIPLEGVGVLGKS